MFLEAPPCKKASWYHGTVDYKSQLFLFLYFVCLGVSTRVVVHHVYTVFTETRRGCHISWNYYRWLWVTVWGLAPDLTPLTTAPPLQSPEVNFSKPSCRSKHSPSMRAALGHVLFPLTFSSQVPLGYSKSNAAGPQSRKYPSVTPRSCAQHCSAAAGNGFMWPGRQLKHPGKMAEELASSPGLERENASSLWASCPCNFRGRLRGRI